HRLVAFDVSLAGTKSYRHGGNAPRCLLCELRTLPLCQESNVYGRIDSGHQPRLGIGHVAPASCSEFRVRPTGSAHTNRREIPDRAIWQSISRVYGASRPFPAEVAALNSTAFS